MHGDLRQQIQRHSLFQESIALARGRSVVALDKFYNLFLLITMFFDGLETRNIIEFGSYKGGSVFFFANLLNKLYPGSQVYSFDTFEGMPSTNNSLDLHREGDFKDTVIGEIRSAAQLQGLENVVFVKGLVEQTFPAQIPGGVKFGLAHIDLDIYEPIAHCQSAVLPFMVKGGYLVYDDATTPTCIGATQAVEEFIRNQKSYSEQIFPHFVFRADLAEET